MSEEEIIKYIKTIRPKNFNNYKDETNCSLITKKQVKAIEDLLDLYKKQKDRIKELEEKDDLVKYCRGTLPKDTIAIMMCNDDFCRNFGNDFISKDKINAKIEELLNSYMKVVKVEDEIFAIMHNEKIDIQIKVLQKLLED